MGKLFLALFGGFVLISMISFCSSSADRYNVQINQNISAGDDLDLKAVGNLVKDAKDAEELEKLINRPSINNLDLDENGKVDYIKVEEYGTGNNRGFSLTVEVAKGDVQEIATIDISKTDEDVDVQVQGNQNIYGQNHYYHSRFGLGDVLLMSWLLRPHPYYISPWGFGYYPSYYRSYGYRPTQEYRRTSASTYNNSSFKKTSSNTISGKAQSPNQGKTANSIKAPLKNPTASQKSFQTRNPSKRVGQGGFGRTNSKSIRSSSSSRSGGFFGGK